MYTSVSLDPGDWGKEIRFQVDKSLLAGPPQPFRRPQSCHPPLSVFTLRLLGLIL